MIDHHNVSKPVIKLTEKAASKLELDLSLEVSIAQLEQHISPIDSDKQTCTCDSYWKGKFCNQQNESHNEVKGIYVLVFASQ